MVCNEISPLVSPVIQSPDLLRQIVSIQHFFMRYLKICIKNMWMER